MILECWEVSGVVCLGGCACFYKFKPTKTSWCAAEVAELA